MRRLGIFGVVMVALTSVSGWASVPAPAGQLVTGPDVPTITAPVAVLHPFADERFTCTQTPRTHHVSVPDVDVNRVLIEVTITPDGDPWDRLYGVAIGGVEVIRGTTPRTKMTVRKDITEYARLLPRGGNADVSLMLGTYVGDMLGSVSIELYSNEPTAALGDAPADVRGAVLWSYLDTAPTSATVVFGSTAPASAAVEFTMSGHSNEEDWFLNDPIGPREFHILVDGTEVATSTGMPYVYSPVGLGNSNANTACNGPGTSSTGDAVHPVLYWTAQQAADAAGVHGGVGEIPAARVSIDASLLPLLTGSRNVTVVITNGGSYWVTSAAFVLG